jgi:cytochrome c oxidase subunit 2
MIVPLILVLVAVGSVLFHVLSPWWWTPIASNWNYIDNTIIITFWITGIAFAAVILFMSYCVFRFRHQEGRRAAYEPENKKLEWWLTVATAVGVAAMLAPGLFVWKGRPPGHLRHPARQFGQSLGLEPERSQRTGRRRDRGR